MLRLYNSLTKRLEDFIPLHAGRVSMYVCGPTVYGLLHIGNARTIMFWDIARRYLEHCGYQVDYVQNFTDIDDKIIKKAQAEGVTAEAIASRYTEAYFADMDALGVRRATHYPCATDSVGDMIRHIEGLLEKGLAYVVDGDVYFRVAGFPDYGKLSGRAVEDNEAGARVEVDDRKREPADFALWKAAKPGEPAWGSPWGQGRPGWHIECSAMVRRVLGDTIDIHAGGKDLKFPHHENEIAQSEGLTGLPFARTWMHTGFLNMGTEKMSKSLGNIRTTRDVVAAFGAQPLRYFMLQTLYRSDLDFTEEAVKAAATGLANWRDTLARLSGQAHGDSPDEREQANAWLTRVDQGFSQAMNQDLNTAAALAHLQALTHDMRRAFADGSASGQSSAVFQPAIARLRDLASTVLGLDLSAPERAVATLDGQASAFLDLLVSLRAEAKTERNWGLADRIRDRLLALGVRLIDQKDGTTTWEAATPAALP
ncbi:MAG: cysteine--tRNA ligase [Candidatus Sericytochromatia bacterium]|nr:cysteine--tRNA ligase [Candidatus Sericytochromatia bacterium]